MIMILYLKILCQNCHDKHSRGICLKRHYVLCHVFSAKRQTSARANPQYLFYVTDLSSIFTQQTCSKNRVYFYAANLIKKCLIQMQTFSTAIQHFIFF